MQNELTLRQKLVEVAKVFLKLGVIGYGGPAAHIAMMQDEIVEKRKWISKEHFLDLMGATNLIPGPNSTEMTMHCGKERAGWMGLFVAGGFFILPAVISTLALAWFYVKYGEVPQIAPIFAGIKPAVIAIILGAIFKLGKKALKANWIGVVGVIVLILAFLGLSEVLAILLGGALALLYCGIVGLKRDSAKSIFPLLMLPVAGAKAVTTSSLFLTFLKVGAILFGSGYVLVAYLQGELVDKLGWLTESELLDAIAIGQFTPGPVLSTATFVGYQVDGFSGAAVATLGIFLPSFLFVLLLNPLVPKLRSSKWAGAFLDGVNIGAVAIMISVTYTLFVQTITDWKAALILGIALVFTFGPKKLSSFYIVLIGMAAGYLLSLI
jgi:chromate transporter